MTELPVVGAAMEIRHLDQHRDWLVDSQRDLEIQDFVAPALLEGDWRGAVDFVKEKLDGYAGRLGIHGPFFDLPLAPHDPMIRDVVRRRLWQGLDACERLGATHMVVHSPYDVWSAHNLPKDAGEAERMIERAHAAMGDAVRRAETLGLTLVVENISDKDPMARLDLVRSFNSVAVAVSVDTGHAHFAHGSHDAPPVDYFLLAGGDKLAHIHLQDADGYADRHWVPGEGSVNWPAVFAAVKHLGTEPRLILEINDYGRLQGAAAYLASLGLVR